MIRKCIIILATTHLVASTVWAQGIVFSSEMRDGAPLPVQVEQKPIPLQTIPAREALQQLKHLEFSAEPRGSNGSGFSIQELRESAPDFGETKSFPVERQSAVPIEGEGYELPPELGPELTPMNDDGMDPQDVLLPPTNSNGTSARISQNTGLVFKSFSDQQMASFDAVYQTVLNNARKAHQRAYNPTGDARSVVDDSVQIIQQMTLGNALEGVLHFDSFPNLTFRIGSETDPDSTFCDNRDAKGNSPVGIAGQYCSFESNTVCLCEQFLGRNKDSQAIDLMNLMLVLTGESPHTAKVKTRAVDCELNPQKEWCHQ